LYQEAYRCALRRLKGQQTASLLAENPSVACVHNQTPALWRSFGNDNPAASGNGLRDIDVAILLLSPQGEEQTTLDSFSGVHVSASYRFIQRRRPPARQAFDHIG
jgi:hypothetical protein